MTRRAVPVLLAALALGLGGRRTTTDVGDEPGSGGG